MIRRVISIWLSLAMIFSFVVMIDVTIDFLPTVRGTTLYVNTTGGGGAYTKIQDAIDNASVGYTVFVYNGTYNENLIVNKTLNLSGESRMSTVISSEGFNDVVQISADWVNMSGFSITGGDSAIYATASNITLNNCDLSYNGKGLYGDSSDNKFLNCKVSHNTFGLYLWGSSHEIINCDIYFNDWGGIQFATPSSNCIVDNCRIWNNTDIGGVAIPVSSNHTIKNSRLWNNTIGISLVGNGIDPVVNHTIENCDVYNNNNGIYLSSTLISNIMITKCNIRDNDYGVYVNSYSHNNTILTNNITDNMYGIYLYYTTNNDIRKNNILLNTNDGVYINSSSEGNKIRNNNIWKNFNGIRVVSSSNNWIYHNNMINNSNQAYDDTINGNEWDNGYPSGGNYWNDWTAPDNDRDGFVDDPYIISGGSNQDNYPFSHKWGWDLVAYWPFDEGMGQYANETSGNYNDGVLGGTTNIENSDPEWVNGISGSALKFDSINDYVKIPASDSLNITGNITIEAWIKPFSVGYDTVMWVLSNQDGYEMGLDSDSAKNHIRFEMRTGPFSWMYFGSKGEVNLDRWNYVVVTINSYERKVYINGVLDTSSLGLNVYGVSTYNLSIGSDSSGSGNFFNGIIDEVSIWNHVLTATEIQDNYRNTSENSIFLSSGWNLISIPNLQSDTNLSTVLSSINGSYDCVEWYNISDTSDRWKFNHTSKSPNLNDLGNIDHTMGFWIYITQPGDTIFLYNGIQPIENQTIPLHPGWNLVGYPSLMLNNRTKGLNNLTFGTHVDSIWTFDAANQKWEQLGESDYFIPGRGYWINAKVECEWEVPL